MTDKKAVFMSYQALSGFGLASNLENQADNRALFGQLREAGYTVVLMYGKAPQDKKRAERSAFHYGADGVKEDPAVAGKIAYKDMLREFDIKPENALFLEYEQSGVERLKRDGLNMVQVVKPQVASGALGAGMAAHFKRTTDAVKAFTLKT